MTSIAISTDVKRKGLGETQDDASMSSLGQSKAQRLDYDPETNPILDETDNDSDRRCVDLIVLGISYRSLEGDVKKCFEAFGELVFCEVNQRLLIKRKERERLEFLD